LDIRVLGPSEVVHDGTAAPLTGKPAALLALLVGAHPTGVTPESAIDAVWPTMTPSQGLNNLRVNLTKLRRALRRDDSVVFDGGRYHLRVDEGEVDASRFRAGAEVGRSALAAGNVRPAVESFRQALSEWRGEPFENVLGVTAVDTERERLRQEGIDALHDCARALIADERENDAVRLLFPPWEVDRTRESIAEPLIHALRMCGRQVDALAVFRGTRAALIDHGMDPSNDFAELEYEILEPVAATPTARTGTGRGARFRRPSTFVGRDEQLVALRATWAETVAGEPRLALVGGPAGIGKSALLEAFAAEVSRSGASVLVGTCERDTSSPYVPFADLVRAALGEALSDTPPALLSVLAHLAPELADRLPPTSSPVDARAGRQHLFEAVGALVARPTGPRLVLLDDMHWAQPDAVELFRQVMRDASGQIMIVAGHRTSTPPKLHAFARSMEHGRLRDPDLRLHLPPMNRHEISALIDEVAPTERRLEFQRVVDDFEDVSGGNPFVVCEAVRQLEIEPDRRVPDILPGDVRTLVDRRMGRLDRIEQRIIRAGSVIGRVFSLSMVAAVADVTEDEALDALDVAIAKGLVVDGPGLDEYTFTHPLIRNAVYFGQAGARRARTHIRAADVLERQSDGAADHGPAIARHLLTAWPVSDPHRTWVAARAAGHDALGRFAHDAAAVWYESALLVEKTGFDDVDVAALRLNLGLALDRCGRLDEARTRFFEAAAIARATDAHQLLVAAVEAATPREVLLDHDYAVRLGDLARDALTIPDLDPLQRLTLARTALFADYYWNPGEVAGLIADAERFAGATKDPRARLHLVSILGMVAGRDDDEARLAYAREGFEISSAAGLEIERGMSVRRYLTELLVCGRMEEFDALLDQLIATAETVHIPSDDHYAASLVAVRRLMHAPDADAENQIEAARVIGRRSGIHWAGGLYQLQMFTLAYQRGALIATGPVPRGSPDDPQIAAGLALPAVAASETGDLDTARSILDRIVHDGRLDLPDDNFWLGAVALFSAVATACGSDEQRTLLREALEPRAERFCVFGTGGAVFGTGHHWLARLAAADGDHGVARAHLTHAAEICDNAGATYWAERARREAIEIDGQASIH
jgi:DNA-binding SARP family transcriptional activator